MIESLQFLPAPASIGLFLVLMDMIELRVRSPSIGFQYHLTREWVSIFGIRFLIATAVAAFFFVPTLAVLGNGVARGFSAMAYGTLAACLGVHALRFIPAARGWEQTEQALVKKQIIRLVDRIDETMARIIVQEARRKQRRRRASEEKSRKKTTKYAQRIANVNDTKKVVDTFERLALLHTGEADPPLQSLQERCGNNEENLRLLCALEIIRLDPREAQRLRKRRLLRWHLPF